MPVYVIDTLKPKNGLDFAVVEAVDVAVEGYLNLADAVTHFATQSALAELTAALSDKADTSDITNLQSQIDQIVISASAESVVAPEVAQARVDVNGVEHSTLKDRSDSDYNMLALATDFDNLFDASQAADNKRLDGNGEAQNETGYYTSEAITVEEDLDYVKYGASDTGHRVCFYDVNDRFISASTESTFRAPHGTSYIRFSGLMREKSIAYFHSTSGKDGKARKEIADVNDNLTYELSELSHNVGDIEREIFDRESKASKVSLLPGIIAKTGWNAAPAVESIIISELSSYDTYYLITKKPYSIWTENVDINYYSISYGKGYIRSEGNIRLYCSGDVGRFRKSDNNLPTKDNKFTVPANTIIAITVTAGTTPYIYGFDEDLIVSDDFKAEITSGIVSEAVAATTEIFADISGTTLTSSSDYDETYDSQYANADGLHEGENYISWGLEITQDTELYVVSRNSLYFSICVYSDDTFSTLGVRYRAYESEDTLPYENNPISLTAGQYIILTCQKSNKDFNVALPDLMAITSYSGDIPLAPEHIDQVKAEVAGSVLIKYSAETGSNITERVHVYVPTGTGFVEYEFVHNESVAVNSDIWRVNYAYACDNQFNRRFNLTTGGEWEIAVHLHDRDDFSGGITHGDQVMTDVVFFVDGAVVDITDYTTITAVSNFTAAEASELFDPADSTTVIATHGSEHIFTKNGLKIRQSLLWLDSQQLDSCYMAMHLPAKAITDHMYTDNRIVPFEIETYGLQFSDAKYAVVYGEDSGVRTEFSIGEYPHGVGHGDYLLMTDNGGNAYNKCYYVITTTANIEANTLWKSETYYKFDVNK